MTVVLRSPIYANEDYDLYSVVEFSVRCAVEHAIAFTWLICMNGTSQYHNYPFFQNFWMFAMHWPLFQEKLPKNGYFFPTKMILKMGMVWDSSNTPQSKPNLSPTGIFPKQVLIQKSRHICSKAHCPRFTIPVPFLSMSCITLVQGSHI